MIISGIATALLLGLSPSSQALQFGDFPLPKSIPDRIHQIVLVVSSSWNSPTGSLLRLERHSTQWIQVGETVPVNLGGRGLAWGTGLHRHVEGSPQKNEGDHRAPAGIFDMGPAFGYASRPPMGTTLPYQPITDRDYFVDDVTSDDYNRWIRINDTEPNEPSHRWTSYEVMRRSDDLYQLGVVVQHNTAPPVKGKGSAIFLHVWRGPNSPTAGCTSMSLDDLRTLITWLDPTMSPILIQAPNSEIEMLTFDAFR